MLAAFGGGGASSALGAAGAGAGAGAALGAGAAWAGALHPQLVGAGAQHVGSGAQQVGAGAGSQHVGAGSQQLGAGSQQLVVETLEHEETLETDDAQQVGAGAQPQDDPPQPASATLPKLPSAAIPPRAPNDFATKFRRLRESNFIFFSLVSTS